MQDLPVSARHVWPRRCHALPRRRQEEEEEPGWAGNGFYQIID